MNILKNNSNFQQKNSNIIFLLLKIAIYCKTGGFKREGKLLFIP